MFRSMATLLAVFMVQVAPATAQVIKPRTTRSPTDRLPAPAKITAEQQPDGSIRVVWNAVDGAVSYALRRSVPPAPSALLNLPNAADTVYIDRDIRPGSYYYYQISATNEAGIAGMKSAPPSLMALYPGDLRPPEPPRNVVAVQRGESAEVRWESSANAERYRAERSIATSGGTGWIRAGEPRCCALSYALNGIATGNRLQFRVRAEGRTGYLSDPATSNEIVITRQASDTAAAPEPVDSGTGGGPAADSGTVATTTVRPAVVPRAARLKVGASLDVGKKPAFTNLRLQKVRWVSLDDAKATVDSRGKVLGRAAGLTYIVATGLTADGAVGSVVQRVDVIRR